MRRTEKRSREYDALIEHRCDACGADMTPRIYEIGEVTVKAEVGSQHPDGGEKTTREYDLCMQCFDEIVVPALEARGVKPVVTESDW